MTISDDPIDATADVTIAEMSDELIFLIASASTDEQRKYAAELFRRLVRAVARDAYRRGELSAAMASAPDSDAVSIVPTSNPDAPRR